MDEQSFTIRVPRRWIRISMIVSVTALIVAPLTAIATHTFNDVPNSHTFHNDIAWLKDADVTRGCNPPTNNLYCPDDDVTRGQMAAFMKRLAENQVVDAASAITAGTADNADAVNGLRADELSRVAFATAEFNDPVVDGVHVSTEITAPTSGYLSITYNGTLFSELEEPDVWTCGIRVNGVSPSAAFGVGQEVDLMFWGGCTAHLVHPVPAGEHTVEVAVQAILENAEFRQGILSVHFVPFGPDGSTPVVLEADTDETVEQQLTEIRRRAAALGLDK